MADPSLPTLPALESAPLRHRFDDMFNPPGLTNFLGAVQVDYDLVAVRSVNFPPVGQGDNVSGTLFVDGRLLRSLAPEVTVRWRPDRITRSARVGDLALETVTVCPPGATAVAVDVRVTNLGPGKRTARLALAFSSRATITGRPWNKPEPPGHSNRGHLDRSRKALVGVCPKSFAACVQGLDAPCEWVAPSMAQLSWDLEGGETRRFGFVQALGRSVEEAGQVYDRTVHDVPAALRATSTMWQKELDEVFLPGVGSFAGSLPRLETSSESLQRLYWTGLLGVMMMRRDSPDSRLGRSYDTLMPRYWQTSTFIWDYSLSSTVHALLDPVTMRRQLEHWVTTGTHSNYGTQWLTGKPFGVWYSVNDYAMTRLVRDYARYSGDRAWLDRSLPGPSGKSLTVRQHAARWARRWRKLRGDNGLADYGGEKNLLECVSTYTNEVAGLNAMNVWCLRAAAELVEEAGQVEEAKSLRGEADQLVGRVLELYVAGQGYWYARHSDGSLVPVRHCYDFQTTGYALADELSSGQRQELVEFFRSELQTPTWMRAMSTADPDAATSLRPDHQWNGAYTAWPAEAAQALYRLGAADVVADWLPGLARSAQEGPFGQGHFTDVSFPARHSGAPKGPPQYPYLMDWACSSSGSFVGLVLEGVFGLQVPVRGGPKAAPRLGGIDTEAQLRGLTVAGRAYDVSASGVRPARG